MPNQLVMKNPVAKACAALALGALTLGLSGCGGDPGGDPGAAVAVPEFTRLCESGVEVPSTGVCVSSTAFPSNAPACTRDNRTGLVWQAGADLSALTPNAPSNLCGSVSWRAPTVREMLTLDRAGNGDAKQIDRAFFPDLDLLSDQGSFASSETYAGTAVPWAVNFFGPMLAGSASLGLKTRWVSGAATPATVPALNNRLTDAYRQADAQLGEATVAQAGGLMWMLLPNNSKTWADAGSGVSAINALASVLANPDLAGLNNWRLPTRLELDSLVNRQEYEPAVDNSIKSAILVGPPVYWTASSATAGQAWVVDFTHGDLSPLLKTEIAQVIYVRP